MRDLPVFEPETAGSAQGSFSIETDAAGSPHVRTLTGTGTPSSKHPDIRVLPASHDFGTVEVGHTSSTFGFEVRNIGDGPLKITGPVRTRPLPPRSGAPDDVHGEQAARPERDLRHLPPVRPDEGTP